MVKTTRLDPKRDALRKSNALHPHPEKVKDPLFLKGDFFDRRDLVQVKYEMLRRVRVDDSSNCQRRCRVRTVTSFVLRGTRRLCRTGPPGATATKAWPSRRTQARPGDRRLRSRAALDGAGDSLCRARPSNRGAIRAQRPPSQRRKSAGSSGKSRRDDEFVSAEPPSSTFNALTTRYERLRSFVLGAGGDADGLVVLLRGGTVAWLQAQISITPARWVEPELPRPRDASVDPGRAELVRLVANMISQHLSEEAA